MVTYSSAAACAELEQLEPRLLLSSIMSDDFSSFVLSGNYAVTTEALPLPDVTGYGSLGQYWIAGTAPISQPASVAGRQIFFNNSALDGNDPVANAADDAAIATNKQALLPGAAATATNFTNYARGINGVMIDIYGLTGTPTAADFAFTTGNTNDPGSWAVAPVPLNVTTRPGAGADGSDRVTVIWADGVIADGWLRVEVLATSNTGLTEADVFYWGNLRGDADADGSVNLFDLVKVRQNYLKAPADPTRDDAADVNYDGNVDLFDLLAVRSNYLNQLTFFSAPDVTAPDLQGITISAGTDYIQVDFTTDEDAAVVVEYGLTAAYELGTVIGPSGTTHSIRIEGLTAETAYQLRIRATDASDNEGVSDNYAVTTEPPPDVTAPVIQDVVITAGVDSIQVDFTTDEAAAVVVEYGLTAAYELGTVIGPSGTAHSIRIEGLTAETAYQLRIRATDANDNEAVSDNYAVTTEPPPDVIAPVIQGVVIGAGHDYIQVDFTTDEDAAVVVEYGLTAAYELGTVIGPSGTTHSIRIEGLTADTAYQLRIRATDSSNNQAASDNLPASTLAQVTIQSDDFNSGTLNTALWQFIDPMGDSTVSVNGSQLLIAVPGGSSHDMWTGGNMAARLMQAAADEDFEIEVKFGSQPTGLYAMNGIIVEQSPGTYVRFEFYSSGAQVNLFAASFTGDSPLVRASQGIAGAAPMYMRIQREADQWTQRYSYDGQTWLTGASFSFAMEVTSAGVFVGNAGSNPAYTGVIDYFYNTAALPPDVTPPVIQGVTVDPGSDYVQVNFTTNENATVVVEYGLTGEYELGTVTGSSGKAHSIRIEGLAPETAYQLRIRATDGSSNETVSGNYAAITEAVPPPDVTAPVIQSITVNPGKNYIEVSFTTDEPATVALDYGPTTDYELGTVVGPSGTTHSLRIQGLTPDTAYQLRIRATDASDNQATSDNLPASTLAQVVIQSDNFNSGTLNTALWQFIDPMGDSTVSVNGSQLWISVPAGSSHDVWTAGNMAARLMQAAADEDFEIEMKFDSQPMGMYALNGIIIEQSAGNYLRFDFYSSGGQTNLFAASFTGNAPSVRASQAIAGAAPMYMRVQREGDQWTQRYSYDGQTWLVGASFSFAMEVASAGVFVGNAGSNPPAYTGKIDYFLNTAIVPPDVTPPVIQGVTVDPGSDYIQVSFTTNEDAAVVVEYGLTSDYELGTVTGPAGTTHSIRIEGLTAETAYRLRIRATDGSSNETVSDNYDVTTEAVPPPDVTPPVLAGITISAGTNYIEVSFTTDEPATVALDYGLTTDYELGAVTGPSGTTHSIRINGLTAETAYQLRIRATDGSSNEATSDNLVGTTQPGNPIIEVWYGNAQRFGQLGNPQRWVNVLGRVTDSDGIASLSYRLNGGPVRQLSVGPNLRRLENPGDFNVEIDRAELVTGLNTIEIRAVDSLDDSSVTTVTVEFTPDQVWGLPYAADWSQAAQVNELAQVVDGRWAIEDGELRPVELGYDRIVAVGDVTWANYEVTVPITIHSFDPAGFRNPSNGPALGIMAGWQGHYDWGGGQPNYGYWPFGGLGWYRWTSESANQQEILGEGGAIVGQARQLQFGVEYMWKMQAETLGDGQVEYRLKIWEEGSTEPEGWDLVCLGGPGSLATGSVLLIAHHVDASFGTVTVTPLAGQLAPEQGAAGQIVGLAEPAQGDGGLANELERSYALAAPLAAEHAGNVVLMAGNPKRIQPIDRVDSRGAPAAVMSHLKGKNARVPADLLDMALDGPLDDAAEILRIV